MEEIGPYVYREILTNTESHFNENGTLTFAPKRNLVLDMENGGRDPFNDTLQIVNIPLLVSFFYLNHYLIASMIQVKLVLHSGLSRNILVFK